MFDMGTERKVALTFCWVTFWFWGYLLILMAEIWIPTLHGEARRKRDKRRTTAFGAKLPLIAKLYP
jgi:hypothetical protein